MNVTISLKSKLMGDGLFFTRVGTDDKTPTGPAVATIAALMAERSRVMVKVRELEGQRVNAKHALCTVVATGQSSAEQRAEIARLDAEIAEANDIAKRLDQLTHEVRSAVVSRDAAALFAQAQDQFSATLAALPQTTESTL